MRQFLSLLFAVAVLGLGPVARGDEVLDQDDFQLRLAIPKLGGNEKALPAGKVEPMNLYPSSTPASMLLGPAALGDGGILGSSYIDLKIGPLFFLGDVDSLGTGFQGELVLGYNIIKILGLEFTTGYFWGENKQPTLSEELWGVPVTGGARLTLPILIFNVYGGLALGGYYLDVEVDGIGSDGNWAFGGNGFLGLTFELWKLAVGVEAKYILTEQVNALGGDFQMEGVALFITAGLRF